MAENPVKGPIARAELGKPGPPIGESRYNALKRAATNIGIKGVSGRYVFVSKLREYLAEHPDFSERQVYKRGKVERFACPACRKEVAKYTGKDKLRRHMNRSGEVCHGVS